MDQDSSFINFDHYKKCLEKVQNVNNVALLAANTDKEGYSNFDKTGVVAIIEKINSVL